jgi:predicted Zn-dependent protease
MDNVSMPSFRVLVLALAIGAAQTTSVWADAAEEPDSLPAGLEDFLDARLLESDDRYHDALTAYEAAFRADPTVVEVRIGYADLLLRLGMPDRAVKLLDGVDGLDWHGRRTLALALAQVSLRDADRAEEARAALEGVLDEREDDPNLLLAYAQLLHRMGRIDEAEAAVAKLRQGRSGSAQLASYHAGLLLQLGRRDEAAELFADCAEAENGSTRCRDTAAELLAELGRPGDAADVLLAGIGDDELDQQLRAAFLLWEANRPSEALPVVERVLRRAPDSESARTLRAHLLSATGRYDEAAVELRALIKKNPTDTDLKLSLAWALARTGDVDEARRWLDRAWESLSEAAGSAAAIQCAVTGARLELVAGNALAARDWLARVSDPAGAGQDYVRLLGESYRRGEDWRGGVEAMVRLQPRLEGEARAAAQAIEAEFRLRTSDPRAWRRLEPLLAADDPTSVLMALEVLQAVERWDEAADAADAATERFPDNREILFMKAVALERLGRFDDAVAAFLKLLENDPTDAAAANYLGYLWADRGTRLEEALELITVAVTAEPDNSAYLDSLGWVYYRLGAMEEAEHWLRRSVELNDGDGTVLAHLGEVLVATGRTEEGIRLLRLALDRGCEDPEHVRALLDRVQDAGGD